MRGFILGLLLAGLAFSLANPSAVYCEDLGYEYRIVDTAEGQDGVCVLPDGSEVNPWDFLAGTVGGNYSYCAQQGYELVPGEGMATCVLPDGSNASVSELMDLSGSGGLIPPEDGEDGAIPKPVVISVGESTGDEEEAGGDRESPGRENLPEEDGEESNLTVVEGDTPAVIGVGEELDTASEDRGPVGGIAVVVLAFIIIVVGVFWIFSRK